jgi:ABC-type phosphate transport system auxiliary subunit
LKLNDFQVWYDIKQRELYIEDFNRINESNIEFQKKIVGDIIARIESGKGFTLKAIEHRLLGCFTLEQASEILKNINRVETLLEMIERLKESDIIEEYSYSTLKNVLRK